MPAVLLFPGIFRGLPIDMPLDGRHRQTHADVPPQAVTLGIAARAHRPQSAIPFPATLKPLELCNSIYAKPVKSAAITPQLCGKRKPIPFLYASYLRSRAVRPVREAAEGKVGVQRGRETVGVPPFLRPPRVRPVPAARKRRNPRPAAALRSRASRAPGYSFAQGLSTAC